MDRLILSSKQAKFIKSLKIKKFRHQERLFLVEGRKNIEELFQSEHKIRMLVCSNAYLEDILQSKKIEVDSVLQASVNQLESLGTLKSNPDCLAVVEFLNDKAIDPIADLDHLFLFDNINDPGNLGTMIRTLDWFGFKNAICSLTTTDHYAPKVVNTSKGSFFRMKIYNYDLKDFIERANRPVYFLEMKGDRLTSLKAKDLAPSIFVMGSESHGISNGLIDIPHKSLTIPAYGSAESLNVGIATGILCNQLREG